MNVATLVVDSRIDRVTVYRNGALVVRTASVEAPASWPVTLKIPGLPLLFQSDTVRIRVLSPGLSAGPIEEEPELSGAHSPRGPDPGGAGWLLRPAPARHGPGPAS